jgi:hypothetical protein
MIVCWLTLQIFAASPVVKTVFMLPIHPLNRGPSVVGRQSFEPSQESLCLAEKIPPLCLHCGIVSGVWPSTPTPQYVPCSREVV